jgi:hypothetical protein
MQQKDISLSTKAAAADVTFLRVVLIVLLALSLGNATVLFALL